MKSTLSFCFVALLVVSTITGCKSDSTSSNNTGAGSNGLSATVSGSSWTPDVPAHAIFTSFTEQTAISASKTTGESMGIMFNPGVSKAGTYKIGIADSASGVFVKQNPSRSYSGWNGTVTVSSWTSSHITGTFNFVAKNVQNVSDSVVISGGAFDLDITKQ
jgi:hypothetical protein